SAWKFGVPALGEAVALSSPEYPKPPVPAGIHTTNSEAPLGTFAGGGGAKTEPWFGFCQLHVVGSLKCAVVETLYPYQRLSCGSGFVPCGTTHCATWSLPRACWARGTTMGPVLGCAGAGASGRRCAASGAVS